MLLWRNGRRSGLKSRRRKTCGFKSHREHQSRFKSKCSVGSVKPMMGRLELSLNPMTVDRHYGIDNTPTWNRVG